MSEETEESNTQLESLDPGVVKELCQDYAQFTRVNISEEHGQIVTQIAAIEEQISTFSDLLTQIENNNAIVKEALPKISSQFESLKPFFIKIDRMEDLIVRVNSDFDVIEKQLEEAEGTIVEGTLKNVLKMPLNLFNKQLSEGPSVSLGTTNPRPTFSPHDIFKTENFFDK